MTPAINPAQRRKHAKLAALLEKAKDHVMSPAEIEAQRKSWVCGEMLLQFPAMTYDDAAQHYDAAVKALPAVDQLEAEASARLNRILRLGSQVKWSAYGEPAISDPDTKAALIELFEIWCVDALERAAATEADQ